MINSTLTDVLLWHKWITSRCHIRWLGNRMEPRCCFQSLRSCELFSKRLEILSPQFFFSSVVGGVWGTGVWQPINSLRAWHASLFKVKLKLAYIRTQFWISIKTRDKIFYTKFIYYLFQLNLLSLYKSLVRSHCTDTKDAWLFSPDVVNLTHCFWRYADLVPLMRVWQKKCSSGYPKKLERNKVEN